MVGLIVNLVCAWLLGDHHHEHDHHHDLNLRSAYIHVLTDAATSVLAIIALFAGKLWGASWLDPVMGIVGAFLVSAWAFGLVRDTGRVLLDANMDDLVVEEVREVIAEVDPDARISDLHVWRVGKGKYSVILALESQNGMIPQEFRDALSIHEELVHITVEITSKV